MSAGANLIKLRIPFSRALILLCEHELDGNNIQVTWIPLNKVQDEPEISHGLTSSEDDVTWFAYLMHSS